MYLRFGWVVGNVGLAGTLLIVTISTSITFLTGLSISAIATNQNVKIGGAYYMISRSLGIEPGGAIGIPLYFAQALSVALYTIGFAESLVNVFPGLNMKITGAITTILVALLALKSAKAAIKVQYIILTAICISLVSLLFGKPIEQTEIELWGAAPGNSEDFWVVFAVFFPAVTGIMAGVNMSGDLKDPAKSIPKGTLAAIGAGYLVYMVLPIILAMRADALSLIEDPLIMRKIAFWGDAILLGVWGATLSSAVGSILGAPRILQALARDGLFPGWMKWLGKGSGEDDEPRIGTVVTLVVALAAVMLGNLDIIAPILTMFFLTTYAVLNISAGMEQLLGSPSYRPKFKVPWYVSLVGAVGCIAVMLLINWVATVIALAVVGLIFFWYERKQFEAPWGDIRGGVWTAIATFALKRMRISPDPKNWRPHILVLSGSPTYRWNLVEIAQSITHKRDLLTVASVITQKDMVPERLRKFEKAIRDYLSRRGVFAFVRVLTASNPFQGSVNLVQNYGIGRFVPNVVILGFSYNEAHIKDYYQMIDTMHREQRNIILLKSDTERNFGTYSRIDVWWGGLQGNGGLMIVLAHQLRRSQKWRGAQINVKMALKNEEAVEETRENLQALVDEFRVDANLELIISGDKEIKQVLSEHSSHADLVVLGMAPPSVDFPQHYRRMQYLAEGLPTTMFVLAAENLSFGEVLIQDE